MFILSIVSGVLIILSAVFLLRKEFLKAVKQQNVYLEQAKVFDKENLSVLLLDMQKSIDDMNQAFYDIANDLEGKYSIHERELMDVIKEVGTLSENIRKISNHVETLSGSVNQVSDRMEQVNIGVQEEKVLIDVAPLIQESTNAIDVDLDSHIPSENLEYEENTTHVAQNDVDNLEIQAPIPSRERSHEDTEMIDKILSLAKLGYDKRQIAKELGMGLGALELIIKLNALDL